MSIIISVTLMVIAVVFANIIGLIWDKVPLAIFQIATGLILSGVPEFNIHLNTEIFMLAIVAPLMFNDGQNQSLSKLGRNLSTMLSMAVGLAIVTVIIVGFVMHSVWPIATLPVAFMMAAIITPTDAVAVSSITQNVVMPKHVNTALEHESLFNDASGIVIFDLALSSMVSGNFYVATGILSFLKAFFGGLIIGWVIGMLLISVRMYLTRSHTDVSAIVIPINVMTPLIAYWVAEQLGVSGILAVVAAGLAHGLLYDRLQLTSTKLQIVSRTTWDIVSDVLNGFVFVLLGATLPSVIASSKLTHISFLIGIAVMLYVVMFIIRFLWIKLNFAHVNQKDQSNTKTALQVATGGIHGTITLAMAFSIPATINGTSFALRNQLIFIAALVILISILVGTIIYPIVLESKTTSFSDDELNTTLSEMVYAALESLRENNPASREVEQVSQVISSQTNFNNRINRKDYMQLAQKTNDVVLKKIDDMADRGEITEDVHQLYQRIIGHQAVTNGPTGFRGFLKIANRQIKRYWHQRKFRRMRRKKGFKPPVNRELHGNQEEVKAQRQQLVDAMKTVNQAVIDYLNSIQNSDNINLVNLVKNSYTQRSQQHGSQLDEDLIASLYIEVFQAEHTFVQQALAKQKIVPEMANMLNEQISTDELVYMQGNI